MGARRGGVFSVAYDAAHAALALVGAVTPPERALIEALAARYPQPTPSRTSGLGTTPSPTPCAPFTWRIPHDRDLRVIFVEAIMNRTPWRMWDPNTGEPEPGAGTLEARAVLESAFRDLPVAIAIRACCICMCI